jgi:hypothetical protein
MASQSSIRGGRQLASPPLTENFRLTQGPQIATIPTSDEITSITRGRLIHRRSQTADDVLIPGGRVEIASTADQHFNNITSDLRLSLRRSVSCAAATSKSMAVDRVQRWSGMTRTVGDWDGLRRVSRPYHPHLRPLSNHVKDTELWFKDGDCYVHLYAQGASRRGPSFCIPFRVLRQKKCTSLLNVCSAQIASRDGLETQQLLSLSSPLTLPSHEFGVVNLYIPAPEHTSRQDSFRWHVTTRNFFAFLLSKPLVGYNMGEAFVDVQERIKLFRSGNLDNQQDFLQYAEDQGYRDFAECTDYALASLYYAEVYKLRSAWIDAFAHCVGMNESLSLSPEYTVSTQGSLLATNY